MKGNLKGSLTSQKTRISARVKFIHFKTWRKRNEAGEMNGFNQFIEK